jgi:hypothetical protein
MDGWMDGWMDGRTDGRKDGWRERNKVTSSTWLIIIIQKPVTQRAAYSWRQGMEEKNKENIQ